MAQKLQHRLNPIAHVEAGVDLAHRILHGPFRKVEPLRDLPVREPLRDQLKHLFLPLGEALDAGIPRRPGALLRNLASQVAGDEPLARDQQADGVRQVFWVGVFQKVCAGPGFEAALDEAPVVERGEVRKQMVPPRAWIRLTIPESPIPGVYVPAPSPSSVTRT